MFKLDVVLPQKETTMFGQSGVQCTDLVIWHKRCGHMNYQRLQRLSTSNLLTRLPKFHKFDLPEVCLACQFGKQSRQPFPHQGTRASDVLEIIHTDVWTASQPSLSGSEYFVSFIDDYSRKIWVYFLKHKSEVLSVFHTFKTMVEKQSGKYILQLRSDGGGEFLSHEFDEFLRENGIERQITYSYTPQQNGVAERTHILWKLHVPC